MKSKVIVMSKRKYLAIFSFALIFALSLAWGTVISDNDYRENGYNISQKNCQQEPASVTFQTTEAPVTQPINSNINELEIQEIDGIEVIGKLEIPKIELTTYVLSDTSRETLDKSVTKLCGPKVNGVGNLCITGHNYHKNYMFGDLKKVELNDKIYLTGTNGNKIEYVVYDIYTVYPKEVECLSQETEGERQITLITCTTGAVKRLIVKATEVYD